MDTAMYDSLRHFADSWGLVYMMAIFAAVVFLILRPGAGASAEMAARIPLEDAEPLHRSDRK